MTAADIVLWFPKKIGKFVTYVWETIQKETFPIWLTLVGAIIGGVVTWYGVPGINQQLEFQKMRASYLTKALDELSATSSEYIGYVSQIKSLKTDEKVPADLVGNEARTAARLVWQASDLQIVLKDKGLPYVRDFQLALNKLVAIARMAPSTDDVEFEERILTFLVASHDLSGALADFAQLRP